MFMKKYIEEKAQEQRAEQLASLAESTIEHNASLIDQLNVKDIMLLRTPLSSLEKSKRKNDAELFDNNDENDLNTALEGLAKDKGLLIQEDIELKTADEYKAFSSEELLNLIKRLNALIEKALSMSASKKQKP